MLQMVVSLFLHQYDQIWRDVFVIHPPPRHRRAGCSLVTGWPDYLAERVQGTYGCVREQLWGANIHSQWPLQEPLVDSFLSTITVHVHKIIFSSKWYMCSFLYTVLHGESVEKSLLSVFLSTMSGLAHFSTQYLMAMFDQINEYISCHSDEIGHSSSFNENSFIWLTLVETNDISPDSAYAFICGRVLQISVGICLLFLTFC